MPSKRTISNKTNIKSSLSSLNSLTPLNQNKTIEPIENPLNEVKTKNYELPPLYQFEIDTYQYRFQLVWIIFGLIVTFFILDWLNKVSNKNKCQCANINEGYLLKEWFMFLIIYQIFVAIIFIINGSTAILAPLTIIIAIIIFVMIVRLLIYIDKLKKIKCDCGFNTQQNIIYYYWIVIYSVGLFFILSGLLIFILNYIINK